MSFSGFTDKISAKTEELEELLGPLKLLPRLKQFGSSFRSSFEEV